MTSTDTRTLCPLPIGGGCCSGCVKLIQRLNTVHLELHKGVRWGSLTQQVSECVVLDFYQTPIDVVVNKIADRSYVDAWRKYSPASHLKRPRMGSQSQRALESRLGVQSQDQGGTDELIWHTEGTQ